MSAFRRPAPRHSRTCSRRGFASSPAAAYTCRWQTAKAVSSASTTRWRSDSGMRRPAGPLAAAGQGNPAFPGESVRHLGGATGCAERLALRRAPARHRGMGRSGRRSRRLSATAVANPGGRVLAAREGRENRRNVRCLRGAAAQPPGLSARLQRRVRAVPRGVWRPCACIRWSTDAPCRGCSGTSWICSARRPSIGSPCGACRARTYDPAGTRLRRCGSHGLLPAGLRVDRWAGLAGPAPREPLIKSRKLPGLSARERSLTGRDGKAR